MVTGHKSRIYWGKERHLDFDRMRLEITKYLWRDTADQDIYLDLPFYSYREAVTITDNLDHQYDDQSLFNTNKPFPHES